MRSIRTLAPAALALSALLALPAPIAVAQEAPPPEPVGDLAFVDSGRTAIFSRFGAAFTLADHRPFGSTPETHSEALGGYLAFDWVMAFASFGQGSAIVADLGMNLEGGTLLSGNGDAFGLGDFVMNVDATFAVGFRQDLAIETYVMALVGYRFGLIGQVIQADEDLVEEMWHLGYLQATFRHDLLAVVGGVGFGQGGLHFHAGPRVWWFDSVWIGAEVEAWITPDESELWGARAFIELRQE